MAAKTKIPSTERKKNDWGLQIPSVIICRNKPIKTKVCRTANMAERMAAKLI